MSDDPVKVLIVDDNVLDAEMAMDELLGSDVRAEFDFAKDEAELRHSLAAFEADVILCDFAFPRFTGLEAIAVMREYRPLVPVIFVSGTISEERAVIALQSGAVDYVLKSNLVRLPSAVRRAVSDARENRRLRGSVAVAELRGNRQAERFAALWRITNDLSLEGDALIVAMLTEAAAALRSPQPFGGVLTRVKDGFIAVVATTVQDEDGRGRVPEIGTRMPLSTTLAARTTRTGSWVGLTTDADAPPAAAKLGWRSVITSKFSVADQDYYITFGSLEPVTSPFRDETVEYVELVAAAFANRIHLNELETSLRKSDAQSRFQADRLERLWAVATNFHLSGRELWLAMLTESAASIRPDVTFRAWFGRIDGVEIVHECIVESPDADSRDGEHGERVGNRVPLAGTIVERLVAEGGGSYWVDDVHGSAFEAQLEHGRGWRSLITSVFTTGETMYGLMFAHGDPVSEPFGPNDGVYLKMLGSFFIRNIQQL